MSKSIVDRPPSKALRLGLRLPIWLYRARLGWLLGDRFLMLTHTGRKSGLPRQTVIEVVQHDKGTDTYYVVSGWGEKSDWYQNIRKSPSVTVHVGGRGSGHRRSSSAWRRPSASSRRTRATIRPLSVS